MYFALKRLIARSKIIVPWNMNTTLFCLQLSPLLLALSVISILSTCNVVDSWTGNTQSVANISGLTPLADRKCWHMGQGIDWLNAEDASGYELVATIVEGAYPKVQFLTRSTHPGDCTVSSRLDDTYPR